MMKKLLALTALTLVFALAFAVPASAVKPADPLKAQKADWFVCGPGESNDVTDVQIPGHVNFNTPAGEVTMIVNGVITLEPNTTYCVFIRDFTDYTGPAIGVAGPWREMVYFTTDGTGYGEFHLNIANSDLRSGSRGIQVALNPLSNEWGHTVAATKIWTTIQN